MRLPVRRRLGLIAGILVGVAITMWLHQPGQAKLLAPGPMNTGHGELACSSCHTPAPGTVRQQLQTFAAHWLEREPRHVDIDLGYRAVTNDACQSCHNRPDDRHPVFRFLEPRFAEARAAIHPEQCASCHREHAGARVTVADGTYCRQCHGDLDVDNDPLDVPHRMLVQTQRWESCLGCHDYHGNHALKPPMHLRDAIAPNAIRAYLHGGPSPYPPTLIHAEVKKP